MDSNLVLVLSICASHSADKDNFGPAYRNRTHIHGVEDRCIIHYTKAGKFGALPQIRTETLRLLRPLSLPIGVGGHLVQLRGIEPLSMVLQTTAMTTSAKVANGTL